MSTLERMMVFVDGENLVFSYQDMIDAGHTPLSKTLHHIEKVAIWRDDITTINQLQRFKIIRTTFYTSAVGSEEKLFKIKEAIKNYTFHINLTQIAAERRHRSVGHVTPKVFKKPKQTKKTKGVDIQMTVDILSNTYNNTIDAIYLLSGDGDFIPVIEEVKRQGKLVILGAFSNGLNKNLPLEVDDFISLDEYFFVSKKK